MIPNPFIQQLEPLDAEPQVQQTDPFASDFNAALRARELSSRLAVKNMVANQQLSNASRGLGMAAVQGGKYLGTTLSGASARAAGAVSLGSDASTLSSIAAPALSTAAVGYGAYKSNEAANKNLHTLNDAVNSGSLNPDQEAAARQKVFNAGMVSFGLGSLGGALGGGIIGGAAGGAGGAKEAMGAYDNFPDAARAFGHFVKKPWAR